jgi:hypothetical protein
MNSERTELKEIKKNTTGTGLLIENDGHNHHKYILFILLRVSKWDFGKEVMLK